MLKANIINESFDNMLRNIINESKLTEDTINDEDELRSALTDAVSKLMEDRIINLKQYEIALQDAIEKVYPDYSWWEITSTNIFMDLFEKRDPWTVVDDIMNTLTLPGEEEEDQEYTPSLTSDDMNGGQWYESLKEETEDKVELATKTKDQKILAKLADDPDKNVREVVAMRINDKKILNKLSGDESWLVRKEVARRGIPEILSKLVNDKNPSVREAVAIKTKDPEILAKLAKDKDRSVISAIMSNKSVTNKIIDTINDSTLSGKNESLKESKKLDEKIPKDLSRSMRNDFKNSRYVYRKDSSGFNRDSFVGADKVVDYENSNYRVLFPQEVLGMKKRGEDLSNIYVIDNNGDHIKLDSEGHPTWDSADKRGIRINQSLNKTLANANKIYIADEKFVRDTQPEKFAQRHQDPDERNANMELGAYRYDKFDEDRYRKGMYTNDHKSKKAIERAKQDFEDGDISRKEMERIIANNSPQINTYYGRNYQNIRDRQSDAINYSANKSASAKVSEYKELKQSIPEAERAISRAKDDIEKFNNGQSTSGWSDYGYNKRSADRYRKEIEDLERKLEFAKKQLQSYESKLTDDAKGSELKALEDKLAKANDDLEAKTSRLKALLRKNEALRRMSKSKKLDEAKKDLSKIDGTVSNAVQKNLDRFGSCESVADIVKLLKEIFKEEGIDNESSRTVINKVSQSRTPNSALTFLMSYWWGGVTYDSKKKKKY